MAITPTLIVAGIGAAAAAGGTAYSIYNGQQQASAQGAQAMNQLHIGQLQSMGASIQNASTNAIANTQTGILDVQAKQSKLGIDTNKAVIGQQQIGESLKQEGNNLNRAFNTTGRAATVQLEGYNQSNDALNRQGDTVDANVENLQRKLNFLQARRATRDAVRAGISAQASALSAGVNRGQGTDSSATAGNRGNVAGKVNTAVSDSNQNRLFQNDAIDLAQQKRELGIQSRELGVNARGINYGLALGRFDLADAQFDVNDKQFGVSKNISDIYLNAQDANSALVSEATGLNKQLVAQNTGAQNDLLGIQKMIYEFGGQNNLLSASAASSGGLAMLGSGIASLGNSFINNASTVNKISQEPFFSAANWNTSLPDNWAP